MSDYKIALKLIIETPNVTRSNGFGTYWHLKILYCFSGVFGYQNFS